MESAMSTRLVQVNIGDAVAIGQPKSKRSPLSLWKYGDLVVVAGIGTLYAQNGFPIAMSFDLAAEIGRVPAFGSVVHELYKAGTEWDRAVSLLYEGRADMTLPWPPAWDPHWERGMRLLNQRVRP